MTREELARELISLWPYCGHEHNEQICVAKKGHDGEHEYEHVNRIIPIE